MKNRDESIRHCSQMLPSLGRTDSDGPDYFLVWMVFLSKCSVFPALPQLLQLWMFESLLPVCRMLSRRWKPAADPEQQIQKRLSVSVQKVFAAVRLTEAPHAGFPSALCFMMMHKLMFLCETLWGAMGLNEAQNDPYKLFPPGCSVHKSAGWSSAGGRK